MLARIHLSLLPICAHSNLPPLSSNHRAGGAVTTDRARERRHWVATGAAECHHGRRIDRSRCRGVVADDVYMPACICVVVHRRHPRVIVRWWR